MLDVAADGSEGSECWYVVELPQSQRPGGLSLLFSHVTVSAVVADYFFFLLPSSMPKSKRAKVGRSFCICPLFWDRTITTHPVSLTKTDKKTREHKETFFKEIQTNVEKWKYTYVFGVGEMRNGPLKDVRKAWKE